MRNQVCGSRTPYICLLPASCLTSVPCQDRPGECIPPSHFLHPGRGQGPASGDRPWNQRCPGGVYADPSRKSLFRPTKMCLFNSGSGGHTQSPPSKVLGAQRTVLLPSISTGSFSTHLHTRPRPGLQASMQAASQRLHPEVNPPALVSSEHPGMGEVKAPNMNLVKPA